MNLSTLFVIKTQTLSKMYKNVQALRKLDLMERHLVEKETRK